MTSGWCDLCKMFHSASCYHPARKVLDEKDCQISQQAKEIERLKSQIIDLNMQINSPVTCLAALKAVEEGK